MNLSFHEKSLWLMFVSLFGASGVYFPAVLPSNTLNILPQQVVLFVVVIALMAIMQIVGQIVITVARNE